MAEIVTRQVNDDEDYGTIMIALVPDAEVTEALEDLGYEEPAEKMHITLALIPERDDETEAAEDLSGVKRIIEAFAANKAKLDYRIQGFGVFDNDTKVLWCSADCPGLNNFRRDLVALLEDNEIDYMDDHSFIPHLTLEYSESNVTTIPTVPANLKSTGFDRKFTHVWVCKGQEWVGYPLEGSRQATAAYGDDLHPPRIDLSRNEDETIEYYRAQGFNDINRQLRRMNGNVEHFPEISELDGLFARSKMPVKTPLYRQVKTDGWLDHQLKPGDILHDHAYTSTTTDVTRARAAVRNKEGNFADLIIHVPKGHPAISFKNNPGANTEGEPLPPEDEILLPRGSKYEVISDNSSGKNRFIHLKPAGFSRTASLDSWIQIQALTQYLYHQSATRNRASIKATGLDPKHDRAGNARVYLAVGKPDMTPDPYTVPFDLWQVDASGLQLRDDPANREGDWKIYEGGVIHPNRLKLVGTTSNDKIAFSIEAGPGSGRIPRALRQMSVPLKAIMSPHKVVLDKPAQDDLAHIPQGLRAQVLDVLDRVQQGKANLEAKVRELAGAFAVRITNSWRAAFYLGVDDFLHCFWIGDHNYEEAERRFGSLVSMGKVFAMKTENYSGYRLIDSDQILGALIGKGIKPQYENLDLHHITHNYPDTEVAPDADSVRIVGHAAHGGVQALVAEVNGTTRRPDRALYHITYSLDPGHKPVESNDMLAKHSYTPFADPLEINVEPF